MYNILQKMDLAKQSKTRKCNIFPCNRAIISTFSDETLPIF